MKIGNAITAHIALVRDIDRWEIKIRMGKE